MSRRASDLYQSLADAYPGDGARLGVVEDGEIVSPAHAPWPVFSITKPMVAALVQQMLALDDPLARWYPEFPHASDITIRHLLQHTSGMPNTFDSAEYVNATMQTPAKPWSIAEVVDHVASLPGHRGPGPFAYCNSGYWLLGAILGADTLAMQLHDRVFAPWHMADTRYPATADASIEWGYSTLWAGPAGAVWSTPRDVLTFLMRGVTDAAKRDVTPVDAADGPWDAAAYGLGLMTDRRADLGLVYGHGGIGPGYTSMALYAPEARVGACVICPDSMPETHASTILEVLA